MPYALHFDQVAVDNLELLRSEIDADQVRLFVIGVNLKLIHRAK